MRLQVRQPMMMSKTATMPLMMALMTAAMPLTTAMRAAPMAWKTDLMQDTTAPMVREL